MTDSTADKNASDGALEVGPSADELFGDIEESVEGGSTDREADDASAGSETIEDRTAADVFDQLQSDVGDDTDDVLSDESPEDIIASADEPEQRPVVEDNLLIDEDALEDLLLTGRTKDKEFLWVDAGDGDDGTGVDTATDAESGDTSNSSTAAGIDADAETTEPGRDAAGASDRSYDGRYEATDTPADTVAEPEAGDSADNGDDTGRSSSGGSTLVTDEDTTGGADDSATDATAATSGDDGSRTDVAADDDVKLTPRNEDDSDAGSETGLDTDTDADEPSDRESASGSDETSLIDQNEEQSLAKPEDEGPSGILGWLRSKLGGLF